MMEEVEVQTEDLVHTAIIELYEYIQTIRV